MNPLQTVKRYLLNGQAAQLTLWAKQNQIKNIEALIDKAAQEIKREKS